MNMRKPAVPQGNHKRFSPEAYADFSVVREAAILELRKRMEDRMRSDEWETVEDAAER